MVVARCGNLRLDPPRQGVSALSQNGYGSLPSPSPPPPPPPSHPHPHPNPPTPGEEVSSLALGTSNGARSFPNAAGCTRLP
eukprot:5656649-Pyramimonas_sp.AAC.1